MSLDLHIVGPGVDTVVRLPSDEPELILGRDAACAVCLPDPDRNVSRRHLALWNETGLLHFRVLSTVNGVDLPLGYAPPGAKGTLPAGQVLKIGEYSIQVRQATGQESDPWALLDRGGATSDATLPRAALTAGRREELTGPAILPEEDPFSDWGFESTFSPDLGPADAGLEAAGQDPVTGELSPFFKGLGVDASALARLSPAELEMAGKALRLAVTGLLELYATRAGAEFTAPGDGVAAKPVPDNNPLKARLPEQAKLQYLLGGGAANIGFVGPQQALTELVTEMRAHDGAVAAAARAAVRGTVEEFAPAALKTRLMGPGSKLFEGARVWDAYARDYADRSQSLAQWVQQLLDLHFQQAYAKEIERVKGETREPRD
jgi:predicted component of type VI protein secretion system